jgi:hypothetical protein
MLELAITINLIHAAWIALWDRLLNALTGRRSETVSIPGGISILLKFDRHNKPRSFIILRDLRIFPPLGFADSSYAYGFRGTGDWNRLVAAVREGPHSTLPCDFRWHKKSGRILYNYDGEQFSLSIDHVKAIDMVVQGAF